VLEYLLGQHCATDDQAQLVKSTLKECGTHKVIDKLTVELNEKGGFYEGCCEG
jgi:ATP-dependent Lon protease